MSLFFPNEEAKLYSYSPSTSIDDYGERTLNYVFRESVPVDIQPLSAKSSLKEFGKILQDTYTCFFEKGTEIYDTDQIVIKDVTYTILGSVEDWNHILDHLEVTVQRLRHGQEE